MKWILGICETGHYLIKRGHQITTIVYLLLGRFGYCQLFEKSFYKLMVTDKINSIITIDKYLTNCKSFVMNCHFHHLLIKY